MLPIIIRLHCWFRLTVQWDDPLMEFDVVNLWGLFLYTCMIGYFDKFAVFYKCALLFRSGCVIWVCTKRVKYFTYHKHIMLHKINKGYLNKKPQTSTL